MPKARPGATRLLILILPMRNCKPKLGEYRTGDRSGPGLWLASTRLSSSQAGGSILIIKRWSKATPEL
jgi:hypothetical protein